MPKNNYNDMLANMQKGWQDSQKDFDTTFGGQTVPEGEYLMKLTNLELKTSQANNLMIARNHIIVDGEFNGVTIYDNMMLNTPRGFTFIRRYIDQMGFDSPEEVTELPDFLESILENNPVVKAQVIKSEVDGTTYTNIRILELIDDEADTSTETEAKEPEEPEEPEEADELLENMATFCATWGLEISDDADFDEMKSAIEKEEYEAKFIDAEEKKLLEDIGLENTILEPKPKLKPKATVKKSIKKKKR